MSLREATPHVGAEIIPKAVGVKEYIGISENHMKQNM